MEKRFLIAKICKSIYKLVITFITLLFLIYFNIKPLIKLKINAWDYAIFGFYFQKLDPKQKTVTYFSQKIINIEKNYEIYNAKTFYYWYHYFKLLYYNVEILTNYSNLYMFKSIYKLIKEQMQ